MAKLINFFVDSLWVFPYKGLLAPDFDILILFRVALSIVLPYNLLLFPIYTPLNDLLILSLVSSERLIPSDEPAVLTIL